MTRNNLLAKDLYRITQGNFWSDLQVEIYSVTSNIIRVIPWLTIPEN
jgi:hypothetical protein